MSRKKRCPDCGSKKIIREGREWKCRVCGYTWSGNPKKSSSKKRRTMW